MKLGAKAPTTGPAAAYQGSDGQAPSGGGISHIADSDFVPAALGDLGWASLKGDVARRRPTSKERTSRHVREILDPLLDIRGR